MPTTEISTLDQYQIALKLRALRAGKQLTLTRLANETRLSTALLSKLETGRMIPTLQTLSRLCRVYGVSLSYFFSDSTRNSVSITRKGHLTAVRGQQEAIRRIPLHFDHIGSARCGASMIEFPTDVHVPASEPGRGFSGLIYVIEGRLDLEIGGTKEMLDAGDCVCIDTDMLVTWGSAARRACQVLVMKV